MTQQVGGDDAAVYNPATLPAELGRIAAQRPDLRLAIAQHPAAYPALLDWLAAQGDPQVVAVVAARRAAWSVTAQPPAYEQPWAHSAQNQPPVTVPLPTAPAPYGQSGQPSVNTPQPMYGTPSQPIQGSPVYQPQGGQAYGSAGSYGPATQTNEFYASSPQYNQGGSASRNGSKRAVTIIAAVAVAALIAVLIWVFALHGGEDLNASDDQKFCAAMQELADTGDQFLNSDSISDEDSAQLRPIFEQLAANSTGDSHELYQYASDYYAFDEKLEAGEADITSMPLPPAGIMDNFVTILEDDATKCGIEY